MRVLQVSDLYPPVPGGLELAVAAISSELVRRGHQVEVLTQAGVVPAGVTTEDGVIVRRVAGLASRVTLGDSTVRLHPPAPDPWVVAELRRVLARFHPDAVHAHGWIAYSMLAALPRQGGPLCVVGLHDYSHVCAKKTFVDRSGAQCGGPALAECLRCSADHFGPARGVPVALGLRAAAPLYRRADVLVANSGAVAAASAGRVHPATSLEVVPPPVLPAREVLGRPDFLPPEDGFVMFVGGLSHNKGIGVLLDAYERTGFGVPLVVLGPRHSDTPTRWPGGVTVVHDVPHDQVLAAWPHAGVAVVPSVWPEPFGMVAVEALTAGVPVVASATGGLIDIVDDEVTGLLVPPGDADALAAAVRRLVEDRNLAERLGREGAVRAARFATPLVVDQLEKLYRSRRSIGTVSDEPGAWPAGRRRNRP